MEKVVDAFIAFPSSSTLSDQELSKQCVALLANWLHKVPATHLASDINGNNWLDLLNPATSSLPYVFILAARIDIGGRNALEDSWRHITSFLECYDPRQIRHAPKEFRRIVEFFCRYASDTSKPILAVKPLQKALLRSNPTHFSFMHTLFTRLCLQAKCYRDAIPILDIDVFDFPASKGAKDDPNGKGFEVVYKEVMEFYFFGAIIYMGVKKWRKAIDYLCHVLAFPGNACSNIQVAAYKKFILVGLLLDGKMLTLPKATSGAAARVFKSLAKPYESFASAFKAGDAHSFRQEIELTRETFNQDGNAGLATQCVHAFRRMQIVALRDTYVTLGVGEIAQKDFDVTRLLGDAEGADETERVILGMIERGEISASLSQFRSDPSASQTTVHFDTSPVEEARNLGALEEQIHRIVALNEQVKQMDRKLGLTKEYIYFTTKQGKGSGGNGPGLLTADSDMMDLEYGATWGDDDPDETVMQDLDGM